MATVETAATPAVVPGVIIGTGRVGQALADIGGGKDLLIRRGESVPADSSGPIFVCTRNDALDSVVDSTPESRREDLVFLQNGMLEPWLSSRSLLSSSTQLLVYFAVAKLGDKPTDGKTDVNPEGLTAVTGKWGQAVADRLHAAGLSCKVLDPLTFRAAMFEKLIWISAFMLVGAKHGGVTVGEVESAHKEEVETLILEMASAVTSSTGVEFEPGLTERLLAYARSVAHFPTAIKEFEWRNGYFYTLSEESLKNNNSDPCPIHTAWLAEVGAL